MPVPRPPKNARLKKVKSVKKPAPKEPAKKADPVPALDVEIKQQKDKVNALKDQYLAEYDKLTAMRAKRTEILEKRGTT